MSGEKARLARVKIAALGVVTDEDIAAVRRAASFAQWPVAGSVPHISDNARLVRIADALDRMKCAK